MKPRRGGRFDLRPIGVIRSTLKKQSEAPKQGSEGAPEAWIEIEPWAVAGLHTLKAGDKIWVITWLHRGNREVLQVHPRSDPKRALQRLCDAVSGPAEPAGASPGYRPRDRRESFARRADRSHRRDASGGHEARDCVLDEQA